MANQKYAEDYEFAQHCLKNKDQGLDKFYKKYKKNIETTISKRLYGEFSSYLEDVFQEVIIYLFYNGGLGKYEGRSKLSTWLFRVVLMRTIDFVRSITRRKEAPFDPVIVEAKAEKDWKATRKSLEEETKSLVHETLHSLREKWDIEKTVMMAKHHMEKLTYKQLSLIFNRKQTTVYNHIREAEDKFRKHFSDLNPDYQEYKEEAET
jgi:RNA polymerase sigma factor (sigma-70 family)